MSSTPRANQSCVIVPNAACFATSTRFNFRLFGPTGPRTHNLLAHESNNAKHYITNADSNVSG